MHGLRRVPGSNSAAGADPAQTAQLPTNTIDQLLAPIALYPDALLAQMLMSATDPAKIVELDKWLKANQTLKGTPLQDAAVRAGFEPSFVALVLFPQVVEKMAAQIAWTTVLGQSFTADRSAVFASIQRLRLLAKNVGTLKSTPQQEVEVKTTAAGQDVIVIEPANPQIVYVPQYNTQVVYTQPPATTTTVIIEQDNSADVAVAAGLIGFTAGIAIGAAMDNHYYYGPYGWHGGGYMYNDAWDDYYDARDDARDDWQDHREDLVEERSDRLEDRCGAANRPPGINAGTAHGPPGDAAGKSTRVSGAATGGPAASSSAAAGGPAAGSGAEDRANHPGGRRDDTDAADEPDRQHRGPRL